MADSLLSQILSAVTQLQQDNKILAASVDAINGRVNALADVKKLKDDAAAAVKEGEKPATTITTTTAAVTTAVAATGTGGAAAEATEPPASPTNDVIPTVARKPNVTSRIILTTYPGQSGIDPIIMNWGEKDTAKRGPVVVSRGASTVRRRNAIGAHGGSYSIYHALAVAIQDLKVDHKPDFTNTEPAATIGPFAQWSDPKKIVAMDPLGHLAPWLYNDYINKESVEIRPTIAITKAHMKLPELESSVKAGRLEVDGKICLNESGELAVTKFAVEPVWYLPGVAERFGIDEGTLRRSLFENTGGSFPELITRNDIKLFLPPIGGLTVYCFGDPAKMSDPNVKLALRVHDECNGSDVFGSDICTCRPYLIFGIEEASPWRGYQGMRIEIQARQLVVSANAPPIRILQEVSYCRPTRYEVPSPHAGCTPLARYYEDRQNAFHVQHEVRCNCGTRGSRSMRKFMLGTLPLRSPRTCVGRRGSLGRLTYICGPLGVHSGYILLAPADCSKGFSIFFQFFSGAHAPLNPRGFLIPGVTSYVRRILL
ncbi:GTP cyclohydrolase N terminal-domain-containing protein [Tuber brumale]|nr:GTP cyclohydrolase N terminal-domain-containing protein [Tuber brumale]